MRAWTNRKQSRGAQPPAFERPLSAVPPRGIARALGLGGTTGDEETLVAEAQAAPAEPLTTDPEAFWSGPKGYDELLKEVAVPEHPAPMASHLGGFPFWRGEKNFASSVSQINERAMRNGLRTFTGDWEIPADSE